MGCDLWDSDFYYELIISTHTSRVGCDVYGLIKFSMYSNFYSHIPCGMWHFILCKNCFQYEFLLTHPVWDVTSFFIYVVAFRKFLLTHPVWDVTCPCVCRFTYLCKFLLTHPVWDVTFSRFISDEPRRFLLTHPVWDVTDNPPIFLIKLIISTHTSRVGCDNVTGNSKTVCIWFLLTHPVWDVTRFISYETSRS